MINFFAKLCIKDYKNVAEPSVRRGYGVLCSLVGIFLNICLFVGKFVAGTISGSISITADAFNNLSDAGSSIVTLIGFKLAGAKPDIGHPFGHGRLEYVSGLVVSGVILLMAVELLKSSVNKILHPQPVEYGTVALVILLISMAVKLYMAYYNKKIGKKLDSAAMRAVATDSLSDTCATFVVFVTAVIGKFTDVRIDGYCGLLVALLIGYAGINAAKETIDPLLGQSPDEEFVGNIEKLVMSYTEVCGIHDLVVHDYGPGRRMISLHAEVPAEGNMLELHDVIDNIERQLAKELKCDAVIHMDPVITKDEHVVHIKEQVCLVVKEMNEMLSLHDFRMVVGPSHTNLIFDIVVPFSFTMEDEEIVERIQEKIKETLGETYFCVIQVDKKIS